MSRMKLFVSVGLAVALAAAYVGVVPAQEEETRPAQPAPRGGPRGGQFDPDQMRQRNLEAIQAALGATDEEWKVLEPRVEKVQTLSREAESRIGMGMLGMFGDRGGRRGETAAEASRTQELSGVQKALQDLRDVLDKEDAKPEDIKAKLTQLRDAREKAKQELHKARQGLRELLTLRQEAQLVVMGLLE